MKRIVLGVVTAVLLLSLVVVPAAAKKGGVTVWDVPGDFATIQEAIDSADVADGDTIMVGPGSHSGAVVTKAVVIKGQDGAVIDDGPNSHSFLRAGFLFLGGGQGSGASIRGLKFVGAQQFGRVDDGKLDFPVFSRGADDVTVIHNVMANSLQAITNWGGSGWTISHNEIIDLWTLGGGGIAILIGDRYARPDGVNANIVSHNKISGTLHVWESDGGGYAGCGIVLYADFRWGFPGAAEITGNRVVKNKISLVSDTPDVVPVVAVELTDTRDSDTVVPVICDNAIGFNDLRGTATQISLTPESLADVNDISRNFGDNRGHGLHPSVFGPGGN